MFPWMNHSLVGTPVVIINREETPFDRYATVLIHDDFKNIFKEGE